MHVFGWYAVPESFKVYLKVDINIAAKRVFNDEARRARQIAAGAEPKTDVKEESPVTLAANEIAEGKVSIVEEPEDENDDIEKDIKVE